MYTPTPSNMSTHTKRVLLSVNPPQPTAALISRGPWPIHTQTLIVLQSRKSCIYIWQIPTTTIDMPLLARILLLQVICLHIQDYCQHKCLVNWKLFPIRKAPKSINTEALRVLQSRQLHWQQIWAMIIDMLLVVLQLQAIRLHIQEEYYYTLAPPPPSTAGSYLQ